MGDLTDTIKHTTSKAIPASEYARHRRYVWWYPNPTKKVFAGEFQNVVLKPRDIDVVEEIRCHAQPSGVVVFDVLFSKEKWDDRKTSSEGKSPKKPTPPLNEILHKCIAAIGKSLQLEPTFSNALLTEPLFRFSKYLALMFVMSFAAAMGFGFRDIILTSSNVSDATAWSWLRRFSWHFFGATVWAFMSFVALFRRPSLEAYLGWLGFVLTALWIAVWALTGPLMCDLFSVSMCELDHLKPGFFLSDPQKLNTYNWADTLSLIIPACLIGFAGLGILRGILALIRPASNIELKLSLKREHAPLVVEVHLADSQRGNEFVSDRQATLVEAGPTLGIDSAMKKVQAAHMLMIDQIGTEFHQFKSTITNMSALGNRVLYYYVVAASGITIWLTTGRLMPQATGEDHLNGTPVVLVLVGLWLSVFSACLFSSLVHLIGEAIPRQIHLRRLIAYAKNMNPLDHAVDQMMPPNRSSHVVNGDTFEHAAGRLEVELAEAQNDAATHRFWCAVLIGFVGALLGGLFTLVDSPRLPNQAATSSMPKQTVIQVADADLQYGMMPICSTSR